MSAHVGGVAEAFPYLGSIVPIVMLIRRQRAGRFIGETPEHAATEGVLGVATLTDWCSRSLPRAQSLPGQPDLGGDLTDVGTTQHGPDRNGSGDRPFRAGQAHPVQATRASRSAAQSAAGARR